MCVDVLKKRYGPYLVYGDGSVIDVRTGKKIKKHLRNGKYVIGLRMKPDSKCTYYQLHRLLYALFLADENKDRNITRYDYIVPKDGDYTNLELSNWELCTAAEYHKTRVVSSGRARIMTPELEEKIKHLHSQGYSQRRIGAECSISSFTVHRILNGTYHK